MRINSLFRMRPLALAVGAYNLPRFVRVFRCLMTDGRVPIYAKLTPVLMLAYFISPVDFDWLPFVGWVDDFALLMLGSRLFIKLCPSQVVREHIDRVSGKPGPIFSN